MYELKRYDCELTSKKWDSYSAEMVEDEKHGEWVRYEDHKVTVERLEALLREWVRTFPHGSEPADCFCLSCRTRRSYATLDAAAQARTAPPEARP